MLHEMNHNVVFTHGGLSPMISDRHVSGIIDWEYAVWLGIYFSAEPASERQ